MPSVDDRICTDQFAIDAIDCYYDPASNPTEVVIDEATDAPWDLDIAGSSTVIAGSTIISGDYDAAGTWITLNTHKVSDIF